MALFVIVIQHCNSGVTIRYIYLYVLGLVSPISIKCYYLNVIIFLFRSFYRSKREKERKRKRKRENRSIKLI